MSHIVHQSNLSTKKSFNANKFFFFNLLKINLRNCVIYGGEDFHAESAGNGVGQKLVEAIRKDVGIECIIEMFPTH